MLLQFSQLPSNLQQLIVLDNYVLRQGLDLSILGGNQVSQAIHLFLKHLSIYFIQFA
jgi:hypothetical protein